jgi:hypothetical protein
MNNRQISNRVAAYLISESIPYTKLDGTINLLVKKANSSCHYAMIEFFPLPDDFYKSPRTKWFTFSRLTGNEPKEILNKLKDYLNS